MGGKLDISTELFYSPIQPLFCPKKSVSFTTLFHMDRCERWSTFTCLCSEYDGKRTITTQCYLHISGGVHVHLNNLRSENYPPSNNLRESLMSMVLYFLLQFWKLIRMLRIRQWNSTIALVLSSWHVKFHLHMNMYCTIN